MDLLRQFNKYAGDQKSLVQKALTSATGVGEALVPQHLEKIITSLMVRLSPEIAVMTPRYDAQKYHEFNRLTALPAAGGAMGEAAVTPTTQATYARTGVYMKIIRRKGAVTNFLQDASKNYIDAAAVEMENHVQAHVHDIVGYSLYGNANANPYVYSGLDHFNVTNRVNEAVGGVVPTALTALDTMIDENTVRQGLNHRKCFIMSPQMLSKFSSLLTNVRLNQGLTGAGMSTVEVPGGWRLSAYRDVPIIQSTQCRPVSTMGTVVAATDGTGTVADDTYYFRVAAVTWGGEQLASAEANAVVSGGSNIVAVKLSWTAVAGALFYKIYHGLTSGTLTLGKVIPAWTYDTVGTPVAAVAEVHITASPVDSTELTITIVGGASIVAGSGPTGVTVNASALADVPLVATGGVAPEYVHFWDLDEFQGLGKLAYTNAAGSRFNGLITLEPLAKTDDNLPFLVKTYGALVDSWEATGFIHRGLRVG